MAIEKTYEIPYISVNLSCSSTKYFGKFKTELTLLMGTISHQIQCGIDVAHESSIPANSV
jgi:hypothetical protein